MCELQGQQEGDWDEVGKEQEPGASSLDEEEEPVFLPRAVVLLFDVGDLLRVIPHCAIGGSNDTKRKLDDKDQDDELVRADLNI